MRYLLLAILLAVSIPAVTYSTITDPINKPEDGDTGATFWDDLETLFDRVEEHDHDGANAELIDFTDITRTALNVTADVTLAGTSQDIDFSTLASISALTANVRLLDADNNYEDITDTVQMLRIGADTLRIVTTKTMSLTGRFIIRGK